MVRSCQAMREDKLLGAGTPVERPLRKEVDSRALGESRSVVYHRPVVPAAESHARRCPDRDRRHSALFRQPKRSKLTTTRTLRFT